MFLNSDAYDEETVKHEWGHFVQFSRMSPITYLTCIGIPSALSEGDDYKYYSNPWEITADLFGGVDRASGYKPGSLAWGVGLFIAPLPVVIAYSLIE